MSVPMMLLQIEDEDGKPPSPFCPLLEEAITLEVPLVSLETTRKLDGSRLVLHGFDDRVVGKAGDLAFYLNLNHDVSFGYCLQGKKIWFLNREETQKQELLAENPEDLAGMVEHLKTRCSQQNFFYYYQLLEEKGKGKNSSVWTIQRRSDQTIFAVKIQKQTSTLIQEIEILRQLKHPNLIFFHELYIEADCQAYIVMDYEDGGSLLDLIQAQEQLSSKDKIKIITDMLNGLEYLRLKGIVHRDLKPENILFSTKDRNYKIADFGLSRKAGTKLEKVAGTPGYLAPELLNEKGGEMLADIKSDIYSMGLIFYETFTLKPFYEGSCPEQILQSNIDKISLKKKKNNGFELNSMQYALLQKMIRSNPEKRKNSCQILSSQVFRKVNKLYGLDYLSSTASPSKNSNSNSDKDDAINDDGLVDSLWKIIRMRSWSN